MRDSGALGGTVKTLERRIQVEFTYSLHTIRHRHSEVGTGQRTSSLYRIDSSYMLKGMSVVAPRIWTYQTYVDILQDIHTII